MKSILRCLKSSRSERVKIAVTDLDGILRGKYVHRKKIISSLESGMGFCNVIFGWDSHDKLYDNSLTTGHHSGYPDARVKLDPTSFRTIPWEQGMPFLLGDFYESTGSKPFAVCPRQLLKAVLNRARQAGFEVQIGGEFEWFNFNKKRSSLKMGSYFSPEPVSRGRSGYSLHSSALHRPYVTALMKDLSGFGIPVESLHTETSPGVLEAALLHSDALDAADRAVLFKATVKEVGPRFGILPSFMAKASAKLSGAGSHFHQSLWSTKSRKNIFYDSKNPLKMSALFESYLAGQMKCLPEIFPLFAPTVNSYKRFVDGSWAPTKNTWGVDNRTVAFRVIPDGPKGTRVEGRTAGADSNPYLVIAAHIASGLYGIENGLKLESDPIRGSAYDAPKTERFASSLEHATERMVRSKLARELFGAEFVQHFTKSRQWEWDRFRESVTDWEIQRYIEII